MVKKEGRLFLPSGQGSLETCLILGQEVRWGRDSSLQSGQQGCPLCVRPLARRADSEIKAEKAQKRLWEVFTEPDVLKYLLVTLD